MKTGKLTIITGAMARELITDDAGKVTAVSYVDKATRTEKQIRCRAVVVAASACESARLLLNSKSARFPNGLANNSGMVGRNLTDTTGYDLSGYVPALANLPRHNCDGIGGMHVYMPWWLLDDKKKGFPARIPHRGRRRFRHAADRSFSACTDAKATARPSNPRSAKSTAPGWASPGRGEMIPNEQFVLRDRSARRRPVGHPGAALPFPLDRARDQAGAPHARHVRRDHRNHGRQGDCRKSFRSAARMQFPSAGRSFMKRARCAWATIPSRGR